MKSKSVAKPDLGDRAEIANDFASGAKKPAAKKESGVIPEGDVRLTANIRQELHLKLKIAAANRRTTIGEIIEDLINKHVHSSQ